MASLASDSSNFSFVATVFGRLIESPFSSVLVLIAVVCVVTRIWTGIQNKQQSLSREEPKEPAVLPYWLPWLGHAIPVATRFNSYLAEASKSAKDGVFHLILAGTVHNVVTLPSVTKQILLQRSTITIEDFVYFLMENFLGDKSAIRKFDPATIWGPVHQVLYQANREPFVSNAAAITVKTIQERMYNLISFSPSWVDQSDWERAADVQVDRSGTSATANMFPLLRHFVGDIASSVLMGQDFMANNPDILSDLYILDDAFKKLMAGLPWWFPGMKSAYRAQSRVVQAVRELEEALYAVWEDRDPGSRWGDLSDVSVVIQNRAKAWRNASAGPDVYSVGDTAVLWAMNANANQVIFWALWHIYQRPTLHSAILAEISPYATLTRSPPSLPIPPPPQLTLDLSGLLQHCPLLKATYVETMRLESPSTSIKSVRETFSVTESAEDAAKLGKEEGKPQTFTFKKGSYICMPHGVHAMDERYWKDPEVFEPRRFFVEEKEGEEKGKGKVRVEMGTLTPFGGGVTMCKGRNFAEREVLAFVAAVLTVWDVEPMGGPGAEWRDPGRKANSGAHVPKRDVRVRFRRREIGAK